MEKTGGVKPVLRWAGGKRRLINRLVEFLPTQWNAYAEPMAGGAALFFYLGPQRALLADINCDLMNFYSVLKGDTSELISRLISLRPSKPIYYKMRAMKPRSRLQRAVRFAYLNRLCWNGLHRVNRRGCFNVPMGDRRPERLWEPKVLYQAAELLHNAELLNADFEITLSKLKEGDFVYLDPPYPRGSRQGTGFNKFHEQSFTMADHERLGKTLKELDKRGVMLMVSLSGSSRIMKYYPSLLTKHFVNGKSLLSANKESRRTVREAVLINYDLSRDKRTSETISSHIEG